MVYRLKNPKTATLMFRSGKLVCTGSRTLEQVRQTIETVAKQTRKIGVHVKGSLDIEIQNIVASADLGQQINLQDAVISLGLDRVEYEPEVFPGMVYRLDDPKVVILLFGSGRFVCTGGRTPQDVAAAVVRLETDLRHAGLLT